MPEFSSDGPTFAGDEEALDWLAARCGVDAELTPIAALFASDGRGPLVALGAFFGFGESVVEVSGSASEAPLIVPAAATGFDVGSAGEIKVHLPAVREALGHQWTSSGDRHLYMLLPQLNLGAERSGPVWACFMAGPGRARFALVSASNAHILVAAPMVDALPLLALPSWAPMALKLILLVVEILVIKFTAPTGWIPALAALAAAITVLSILYEMWKARRIPPPSPAPGGGPGTPTGTPTPANPYEAPLERARKTKAEMDKRAEDTLKPSEADEEELQRIWDDAERRAKAAEDGARATPEERKRMIEELEKHQPR